MNSRIPEVFKVRRLAAAAAMVAAAGIVATAGMGGNATPPKFFPDDPITHEPNPGNAAGVQPFPVHLSWDLISSLFVKEGSGVTRPAQDVNTIGEVPDSNWFTNRAGSLPLTPADVARGPDTTDGPSGVWTIVSGKSEGVRPGFTIADANGVRWFLKFDAPGHPEQATGAEVVATKLFWAAGYNVAETHVAILRRKNLILSEEATITVNGKKRRLTDDDVQRILDQSQRSADGSYRALASKQLDGKPVGEFLYYGTRSDDPNDVIPHEDRRELRGMIVFAAWIDRVDAKAGNTLDTLVQENGMTLVRHHVLDFGSTLGSGGIGPNDYWEGYEYLYSGSSLRRKLLGLGFPVESWRKIPYPSIRGVARLEGDHFNPETWKSRVPNAAYVRADAEDTFWAARKVMAIDDDMIAAAVKSGNYSDPSAERYLTETLIKRRNAVLRAYLPKLNPVVNPTLDTSGVLDFQNAASGMVAPESTSYETSWYRFDNATGESFPIGESRSAAVPRIEVPAVLPAATDSFVRVDIRLINAAYPSWTAPVRVYFRRIDSGWKLTGLYRTPSSNPADTQATPPAESEKVALAPPQQSTSLRTIGRDLASDFKHLPSRESLWIAAAGGAAALAVHPADHSVNAKLANDDGVFKAGAVIGNTATLLGASFATWSIGTAVGNPKVSHVGLDLLRAIAESEAMLQTLKYTVRRERPDHNSGYAFPSGHAADTFAVATVIERHHGVRWSLPGYVVASYVAMSRLHENVHYLSDVVFGAAVGSIAGRTVTRHGASNFALAPIAVPRGGGLALLYNWR
jgi:membrane-associated phospholipid phosphatase